MAGTGKARLVVGLFGTAEALASTLAELAAHGVAPSRINVIAQADALEGALAGWHDSGEARGFAEWVVCRPVGGTVPWAIVSDGAPPSAAVAAARALLGLHNWALRRHAQQLHGCLEQGGALLLVEPDTEAEERTACTALLRYASGGVQTHEMVRPQDR